MTNEQFEKLLYELKKGSKNVIIYYQSTHNGSNIFENNKEANGKRLPPESSVGGSGASVPNLT